jgi:hypothetical protein
MGEALGRMLVIFGVLMVVAGLALQLAPNLPLLGKLPGDLRIERDGFLLVLPLGTCLLVSAVLTLVLQLLARLR